MVMEIVLMMLTLIFHKILYPRQYLQQEEHISKLTVMVNRLLWIKTKAGKHLDVRDVAKVIKYSRISTSIQLHMGIKPTQIWGVL